MAKKLLEALIQTVNGTKKSKEATVKKEVNIDLSKYSGFSEEFKTAFTKQAKAMNIHDDQILDTFSYLDKSMLCEKRAQYIHWLNQIHSN